jgi:ribokinase
MARGGILVVGSANMDLVASVERFPVPGETIFGSAFQHFPGGKGANQAVCAARLGGEVSFIGKLGHDLFGEKLRRGMKHDRIRLDHCETDRSAPTGTAIITVDAKGQNEIVVISGSNMRLSAADVEHHRAAFRRARILLLQLEIPLPTVTRAARMARADGMGVILNPAPARPLPKSLLRLVDVLVPNETELEQLAGRKARSVREATSAARVLLAHGVRAIVVTMGSRGALAVTDARASLVPARKVRPVDTTAAGDAFCGALAYALSGGGALEEAIPFANAVAAFSVTRKGAQSSMPTPRELAAFIRRLPPHAR